MAKQRSESNPFAGFEQQIDLCLLRATSRDRLTLPSAVRSGLTGLAETGSTILLATAIAEGTLRLQVWTPAVDELVHSIHQEADELDLEERTIFLAAAIDRWSRVILQHDGRLTIPPLLQLRFEIEQDVPIRAATAGGRVMLFSPRAWDRLVSNQNSKLEKFEA